MTLHFVLDDAGDVAAGGLVVLSGPEAHHAAAVRRVRVGEEVTVGDGKGLWATGVCETVAAKEVGVRVRDVRLVPRPSPRLTLVQALAKGGRDESAVQAATELGVDVVVPWQAARSISRWAHAPRGSGQRAAPGEESPGNDAGKAGKGRIRWAGIVREAAKQAHRAWVPEVESLATLEDIVGRARAGAVLVLEPSASTALTAVLPRIDGDLTLVVGPEGGIAPEELTALGDAGAVPVRLGDTVLRTSTAGPSALAAVNVALGRW